MGNAALSRHVAKLLREHASLLVKDVPGLEDLLEVSFINKSVSIGRLDLQERLLENLGVYLPLGVRRSWIEGLVLSLQGRVLRLEAKRFVIHGYLRKPEDWEDEIRTSVGEKESDNRKAERLAAHEEQVAGLQKKKRTQSCFSALPELEIDVGDCEVLLWDASTRSRKPFEMAAVASRLCFGRPLSLKQMVECTEPVFLHIDLRFSDYRMYCCDWSPRPIEKFSETMDDANIVLGPCKEMQLDIRVAAWPGARAEDQGEIPGFFIPPSCMGRQTTYDFLLPLSSLAIRSTHCDFKLSQTQLAYLIRFGRTMGFWYRFVGAVTNIEVCEDECWQYQERWLERVKRLNTENFFSNEDSVLLDFEKRYSETQVFHQRAAALFSTAYLTEADQMECAYLLQSNMVADGLFNPMFYTTFVLDVCLEDSLVELFAVSEDGSRKSLRVEANKSGSTSCVRYVLHVEETPWSAPVSNQLRIENCCANYVEMSRSVLREGESHLDKSSILIDSESTIYMMWDLQVHSDVLYCPEQLPFHFHLHCGELHCCIQPNTVKPTHQLISGAMELAELESDAVSQFLDFEGLGDLALQANAVDKSVRPPENLETNLPDVRIATPKPLTLLLPAQRAIGGLKVMVQPEIFAAAPGRKRFASQLNLERSEEFGPCLSEKSHSLVIKVCRLEVWALQEKEDAEPAEVFPTSLLSCKEIGCQLTANEWIAYALRPLETQLAAADINLLLGIARYWQPTINSFSSSAEQPPPESMGSEGEGEEDTTTDDGEAEEIDGDGEFRPKSFKTAKSSKKTSTLSFLGEPPSSPAAPDLLLVPEYTHFVQIRIDDICCKLCEKRGEMPVIEIHLGTQRAAIKSGKGAMCGEYSLQLVTCRDTKEDVPIVLCGDASTGKPALKFEWDHLHKAWMMLGVIWFCVHWETIYRLFKLRELFSQTIEDLGSLEEETEEVEEEILEELDAELEGPQLAPGLPLVDILLAVNVSVYFEKVMWFIPCSGNRAKDGLLMSTGLRANLSRRPHVIIKELTVVLVKLSECGIVDAGCFRLFSAREREDAGQDYSVDVLHPTRISASVVLTDTQPVDILVNINVEPICMSLRTSFVHQALDLQKQIQSMMATLCPDEVTSAAAATQELSSTPVADARPVWSVRMSVTISLVRLGFAHAPSDLELVVFSLEDTQLYIEKNADVAGDFDHFASSGTNLQRTSIASDSLANSFGVCPTGGSQASRTSNPTSPAPTLARGETGTRSALTVQPYSPVLPFYLSGSIRALSLTACATQAMQHMPILEPVYVKFSGFGTESATCSISWINFNLSVCIADAFMWLFRHAEEETARWKASQEQLLARLSLLKSKSLRVESQMTQSSSSTALKTASTLPALRSGVTGSFFSSSYFANVTGDTEFSSRALGTLSELGRPVEVLAGRWQSLEEFTSDASDSISGRFWLTADARFRFSIPGTRTVEFNVPQIPRVQAIPVNPHGSSSKSLHKISGTEVSSKKLQKRFRKFGLLYQNSLAYGRVLVRQQIHGVPPRREIVLSSLVYLENHTPEISVMVLPICDCRKVPVKPLRLDHGDSKAVPFDWFIPCNCRRDNLSLRRDLPSLLYCGLASEMSDQMQSQEVEEKIRSGVLRPLVDTHVWRDMYEYRSMVADDYNLTATALPLVDSRDGSTTNLCASVYGISQELNAPQMPLFFMIAVEPMVQLCNRLMCNLDLRTSRNDGMNIDHRDVGPGVDAAILYMAEDIDLRIELPMGNKPSGDGEDQRQSFWLRDGSQLQVDSVMKSQHRSKGLLHFYDSQDRHAPQWEAKLRIEIGMELSAKSIKWTQRFKVHQYSPLARRLVIYTRFWFINHRSDCRLFVPHARSSARSCVSDRGQNIYQIPSNALRMLPEQVIDFRGRIRVGLYDHWNHSKNFVPVTEPLKVLNSTTGSVWVKRDSVLNPLSKSFGYKARPAPMPFYRTLIVDFFRRYTLVNHKQHDLHIQEYGSRDILLLKVDETQSFDPQGEYFKLAISGLLDAAEVESEEDKFYFDINIEGHRRHFQIAHRVPESAHGRLIQPAELSEDYASKKQFRQAASRKAYRGVWCITAVDLIVDGGAVLVRFSDPEQPEFRIINRSGHDLKIRQVGHNAVLDIPSETATPFCWFSPEVDEQLGIWSAHEPEKSRSPQEYRIGNVEKQRERLNIDRIDDDGGEPSPVANVISPNQTMTGQMSNSFSLGFSYKDKRRPMEQFEVTTRVKKGCREVHVVPWCRVANFLSHKLYVQQTEENGKTSVTRVVHPDDAVLVQPQERTPKETMAVLEIKGTKDGKGSLLKVGKHLVGKKGYVRLTKDHGLNDSHSISSNNVFDLTRGTSQAFSHMTTSSPVHTSSPMSLKPSRSQSWLGMLTGKEPSDNRLAIAEVTVRRDPISKFLVVELKECSTAPYSVENLSKTWLCTISPYSDQSVQEAGDFDDADMLEMKLGPGVKGFYAPPVWGNSKGFCRVTLSAESHLDAPDAMVPVAEAKIATIREINLDQPDKHVFEDAPLVAVVTNGNPRRLVVFDAKQRREADGRKSVHSSVQNFIRGGIDKPWRLREQMGALYSHFPAPVKHMWASSPKLPKLPQRIQQNKFGVGNGTLNRIHHAKRHVKKKFKQLGRVGWRLTGRRRDSRMATIDSEPEVERTPQHFTDSSGGSPSFPPTPTTPSSLSAEKNRQRIMTKASANSVTSFRSYFRSKEKSSPFLQVPSGTTRINHAVCMVSASKPTERVVAVHKLEIQGIGIALLNSESLWEVAYLCATDLRASHSYKLADESKNKGNEHELSVTVANIQVDVREVSGWCSFVVLRPLPPLASGYAREQTNDQNVIDFKAAWRQEDITSSKSSGHLEVKKLHSQIRPLELYLDTMNLFRILEWAFDLHSTLTRRMVHTTEQGTGDFDLGHLALGNAAEMLFNIAEGDREDELVGETCAKVDKSGDDYGAPTPLFVRDLKVECVRCVVSVNFSGWEAANSQGNEDLVALNVVLRKTLPFDMSNADIRLGHTRPHNWVRSACSCWRRHPVSDIQLHDQYWPQGSSELPRKILEEYRVAVTTQLLHLLGASAISFNLPHLALTLVRSWRLLVHSFGHCNPKACIAAPLMVVIGCLESLEGCWNTLAKTSSHWVVGSVPNSLRRSPSNVRSALVDVVWSAPWTFGRLCDSYRRAIRHVRRTRSIKACCAFPFIALFQLLLALVSSLLIALTKITQFLILIVRHIAHRACPEFFSSVHRAGPMRRGPQQHHKGVPVQYSKYIAEVLNVAQKCSVDSAAFLAYWRLRPLPNSEGMILAVRGTGFFHIKFGPTPKSARSLASLSLFEEGGDATSMPVPSITWKALGDRWEPPQLIGDDSTLVPALHLFYRKRKDPQETETEDEGLESEELLGLSWNQDFTRQSRKHPKPLQMQTHAAAMAAFGFVSDFIAEVSGSRI